MKTMTDIEAQKDFKCYLETVQTEPVVITKEGYPIAVTISFEDAEDFFFGEQAKKAGEEGFIGTNESEAVLQEILNTSC